MIYSKLLFSPGHDHFTHFFFSHIWLFVIWTVKVSFLPTSNNTHLYSIDGNMRSIALFSAIFVLFSSSSVFSFYDYQTHFHNDIDYTDYYQTDEQTDPPIDPPTYNDDQTRFYGQDYEWNLDGSK